MKKAKWFILVFVAAAVMMFGAVTVYAMSEETGGNARQSEEPQVVLADYAAEEQAVSAYYLGC